MNQQQFMMLARGRAAKAWSFQPVVKQPTQESYLVIGDRVFNSDGDLLEYIKGFVYDKNGRCLKQEILQAIMANWIGIGVDTWCSYTFTSRGSHLQHNVISECMTKLQEKMDEFENGDIYKGTGLSTETSKMTGRIIYKYVEPDTDVEDLIDISDLTSKFEIGVSVSDVNKRRRN